MTTTPSRSWSHQEVNDFLEGYGRGYADAYNDAIRLLKARGDSWPAEAVRSGMATRVATHNPPSTPGIEAL